MGEVDWVFLPAGAAGGLGIAGAIIGSLGVDQSRLRPVMLAMSRQRDTDLDAYARAAEEILIELREGKSVAWITEGDPLLYSTFGHVWAALRRRDPHIAVEIVPGVTSTQAAAAYVGITVAQLDERVAIVPAAYGLHHLPDLLERFATVFLLKVHGVFEQLLDKLALLSGPPQAFYVEKVGTPEQRVVRDLASLRGEKLPYFSLVILRRNGSGGRHDW